MSSLTASSSSCHTLQLPPIEKDDRLNLNVRTGSASVIYNSFVFTYGGITIGLELEDKVTISEISAVFLRKVANNKLKSFRKYLSGEIFYLDLIFRTWTRVSVAPESPKPRPRLYHELATGTGCLYSFGGLVLRENPGDDADFSLVPSNELWEFNLIHKSWRLLHDGSNWRSDPRVPSPRFCHKMTLINHLSFVGKKDHFGLMIAGGMDHNSRPLYTNCVFDLVDNCYVDAGSPLQFPADARHFQGSGDKNLVSINYLNSVLLSFSDELELTRDTSRSRNSLGQRESLVIYSPTKAPPSEKVVNPLLVCRIGEDIAQPRTAMLMKENPFSSSDISQKILRRTVPYNLRYPTGGVFGQNVVIVGFLPNDYDISIFIYNKPTGKWSRLNIFCNHDYGSHRFWGGFVWTSHHKVILLGNYVTSRTTSSVRYFSSIITVSLPITNILASMELAGGAIPASKPKHYILETQSTSETETTTSGDEVSSTTSSQLSDVEEPEIRPTRRFSSMSAKSEQKNSSSKFDDYVHYAAPKVKYTKVRSAFPPAAITLGRNAFDRYGDTISDLEFISSNGDRIPVCLSVLMERWGKYFIDILSRAYVQAVNEFEQDQIEGGENHLNLPSPKSSTSSDGRGYNFRSQSSGSSISSLSQAETKEKQFQRASSSKPAHKEVPQFRLPFQDTASSSSVNTKDSGSVDPHKQAASETMTATPHNSSTSSIVLPHLREIPAQLPLPYEPIPDVPATPVSYRSSSRKNSSDALSPRASLLHTLTVLRSIPQHRNSRSSPLPSPRGSISKHDITPFEVSALSEAPKETPEEPSGDGTFSSPLKKSTSDLEKKVAMSAHKSSATSETPVSENHKLGLTDHLSTGQSLLDFQSFNPETYTLEPALIPRKLYIPFGTSSLKAFAEYLYTGQVGNRWTLRPVALDCLLISRYFKVPLLYDLISEVLYGIIGRKEASVIREGKKYRRKYQALFERMNSPLKHSFRFPLDEYEGFLDIVDDGLLDIALLRKSSNVHKPSTASSWSSRGKGSFSMRKGSGGPGTPVRNAHRESDVGPDVQETKEESTTDDTSGTSDEDAPPLHFLDQVSQPFTGVRYKSIFEKTIYDSVDPSRFNDEAAGEKDIFASVTLESLVSPDSPEPENPVIDLIHEMASICADVKLMLRSSNARQMALALEQTKKDYYIFKQSLQDSSKNEDGYYDNKAEGPLGEIPEKPELPPKKSSVQTIKTIGSSSSLAKTESPQPLSTLKTVPFKEPKAESVGQNRKLDRQIAQAIKKDEKLKSKAAKEEKKLHASKSEKERAATTMMATAKDTDSVHSKSDLSRASSMPLSEHNKSPDKLKERHRLLGKFHLPRKKTAHLEHITPPPLTRTESSASVVSSSSRKSDGSKKSAASVKGFFSRKK